MVERRHHRLRNAGLKQLLDVYEMYDAPVSQFLKLKAKLSRVSA